MPPKTLKVVQHKHLNKHIHRAFPAGKPATTPQKGPLLFVHRDQGNIQSGRSAVELEEIKQHLAQRHQKKRKSQRRLDLHPSICRIVRQPAAVQVDEEDRECIHQDAMLSVAFSMEEGIKLSMAASIPCAVSLNTIGSGVFDPFTSLAELPSDIRQLLFLYCRQLRPLAGTVSPDWQWAENVPQIQASPMLTYAIAAYASAFFTGLKAGSRGVVLPPPAKRGYPPLWPMPMWFIYQTQAMSLLNEALVDRTRALDDDVYHTIVFLFRLAVMFGDGLTANMHYKALKQVARMQGRSARAISLELAVTRVNFITLYLYKAALMKQELFAMTEDDPEFCIEADREHWIDQHEWNKFQGMLFCRSLLWHAKPSSSLQQEAVQNIYRIDPESTQLSEQVFVSLTKTYQTALYLLTYLSSISFDTSLPKIQLHMQELRRYLQQPDIKKIENKAPHSIFLLFLAGTFACRGLPWRKWFIEGLAKAKIQVRQMYDLWAELDGHGDSIHVMPALLEEVLTELRQIQEGCSVITKEILYQGPNYRPIRGPAPMSKSPDLAKPLRIVEAKSKERSVER